MEELTLFDFDFSNERKSVEELKESFRTLQEWHKEKGLPYFVNRRNVPSSVRCDIEQFFDQGWIVNEGEGKFNFAEECLLYHTTDELITLYQKKMDIVLQKEGVCWYKDVLSLRNSFSPIRYQNEKVRQEFFRQKRNITKRVALKLGLEHFLNVPSSRGSKCTVFSSKWSRKHVLPMVTEHVLSILDIDEMEQFFQDHAFFFGRRDWDWEGTSVPLAPYPEFKYFSPTEFELACLVQAEEAKTAALIFNYMGYSGGIGCQGSRKVLYPEGWSMERYELSLTDEDREVIKQDQERLKRLHGGV